MPQLLAEVERFRSWAATYPLDQRSGEWECDYDAWDVLHATVAEFLDQRPFGSWSAEEVSAVLYAVGRDNELEHLSRQIRGCGGNDLLLDLADVSLRVGEPQAKWQLATQLGRVSGEVARRDRILLAMARDDHEYVRRRALEALARLGSPATEGLALEA